MEPSQPIYPGKLWAGTNGADATPSRFGAVPLSTVFDRCRSMEMLRCLLDLVINRKLRAPAWRIGGADTTDFWPSQDLYLLGQADMPDDRVCGTGTPVLDNPELCAAADFEARRIAMELRRRNPDLSPMPAANNNPRLGLLDMRQWCAENWRPAPPAGTPEPPEAGKAGQGKQAGQQEATKELTLEQLPDDAVLSPKELARIASVHEEPLRKRLNRLRANDAFGNSFVESEARKPREARYLYRVGAVRPIIRDMKTSSERPAKK